MMSLLDRVVSMEPAEIRFRASCALRNLTERLQTITASPQWRRTDLRHVLRETGPDCPPAIDAARRAARLGDWAAAHRSLANHFASRPSAFPLGGNERHARVELIRLRFPEASVHAAEHGDRIVRGHYDLLGYEAVDFASPPDWHADPVHGGRAPLTFWSAVPFLDPTCGDHKIVWELNRHQHWIALGRAWQLSRDRRYYIEFVRQLRSWLEANPPLLGINWASMLELAFRAMSWIWSLTLFAPSAAADTDADVPWTVDLLVALDRQLTHVEHNLSRYFSPNTHLSGEALGLYVAGQSLPELARSRRWAAVGREVLLTEIPKQIYRDGGHAELSAHYQRYTTDFYLLALLIARRSGDPAAAPFEDAARRLARYLRTIVSADGLLPLLGDDDGGQLFPICSRPAADCRDTLAIAAALLAEPSLAVSRAPEEAWWICGENAALADVEAPAPWPSAALRDSGYYVSRTGDGDQLIFDAGPHGFLNGGHAHADALAVVVNVAGAPLLVDPGTATYTMNEVMRDQFRSTTMHNTVVVNGRPQSIPRGPFHWQTRTGASAPIVEIGEGWDYFEGLHDGYEPVTHNRAVLAIHGIGWLVLDRVVGVGHATAEAFWHLHPDWTAAHAGGSVQVIDRNACRSAIASTAELESLPPGTPGGLSSVAPIYGRLQDSVTLRARASGPLPLIVSTFVAANAAIATELTIESLELSALPGSGWQGRAFRIVWKGGRLACLAAVEEDGHPSGAEAAPRQVWGVNGFSTDARLAVLIEAGDVTKAILVNGAFVDNGTDLAVAGGGGRARSALVRGALAGTGLQRA